MKFDLGRLDKLVDLMEENDLGELEIVEGENAIVLEKLPRKESRQAGAAAVETTVTVTATRVGIFSPKVSVGDKIAENAPVGELRVMDVKYGVPSPATGIVEELLIEDGMGVEYGQALMKIRPTR